ncbi:MAG: type II secretion system protein [bacterium]
MIFYSNNLKSKNLKAKSYKLNAGMTYVELIVVLSIFAVMSSIVIFNYGQFQAKVDIKNLASDIALKIVEAQQSTMSGKLNSGVSMIDWKPSYGVYFNLTVNPTNIDNTDGSIAYNKKFNYFVDKDNSKTYASLLEKLDTILITKDGAEVLTA